MGINEVIIWYYGTITVLSLILMGLDKFFAKNNMWRISENTLLLMGVLGGGFGALFGMKLFKHKTTKAVFYITYFICVFLHVFLIYFVLKNFG